MEKDYQDHPDIQLRFMRHYKFLFISMYFFFQMLSCQLAAQSWDFVKEKDNIKLYTQETPGKSLKSFRGIADIKAPAEKVFAMMEDVNNTDWWDKNIIRVKVLLYEKNKRAQYYLVYDLPWPVIDRDLCVDVTIKIDTVTGERRIDAVSFPGIIPESNDMVRIKDYRQTWTLVPYGKEMSHVILEGFVDPEGSVPDWISNMLITDSPFRTIKELRERMEGK